MVVLPMFIDFPIFRQDWFAIPQITARVAGVNEDLQKSQAALAVQSIPGYVEAPVMGVIYQEPVG